MTKRINFYATRADIINVTHYIERFNQVYYLATGNQTHSDFAKCSSAESIESLGCADASSGIGCRSYLILPLGVESVVEQVIGSQGNKRFIVDQLENPNSVMFTPAGVLDRNFVLAGRVASVSSSKFSTKIMSHFLSAFKSQCVKSKSYWLGRQASDLYYEGTRLAISTQTPRKYDAHPPIIKVGKLQFPPNE